MHGALLRDLMAKLEVSCQWAVPSIIIFSVRTARWYWGCFLQCSAHFFKKSIKRQFEKTIGINDYMSGKL